jgi:predicted RNA-binding protein with PIN domain
VRWLVDASNVIGSRPDGWWRDREGAARRLIADLERFAESTGDPVTVVLDAGPPELAGRARGVEVAIAPRRGRDAADDEIVRLLEAGEAPGPVRVVTSDRELAGRVRALGAEVEGARTFRERL